MARTTSRVDGDRLVLAPNDERLITVGTPEWFAWLETATSFAFTAPSGSFTARKEARNRGGYYWKAYLTTDGTLHRVYLGKSSDLTLDRLTGAAATLWAESTLPNISTSATPAAAAAPPVGSDAPVQRDNFLAVKLAVPPPRAQLVVRSRLFEKLEAGLKGKLTVIAAPAGFGKTTLLSAWVASLSSEFRAPSYESALPDSTRNSELRTRSSRVAWVSLDDADNDPVRFWSYLLAAIDDAAPGAARPALALIQSPQPPPVDTILSALLSEIAAGPNVPASAVIVLDDYHVIDARPIDQALTFLIEHMPPWMHLVITSREDPQLSLARLRARGQLGELRASDLRFTPSEAAAFLNQVMGLDLTESDIAELEERTEGWIAGLQLAALSLQGHDAPGSFIKHFTGSHHFVLDYLVEEVLERQSESIQTFLLRTSILDRMCGGLCDAVMGEASTAGDGEQLLAYLEHANLFMVPLDNERHWYRYHHLFADLLRKRLHQQSYRQSQQGTAGSAHSQSEELAALHKRASQWYEENGLEVEAFHHAAAAGDVERAERLIEGAGVPLHFRGAGAQVRAWLESLPVSMLNARPSLWVVSASASMMSGQPTAVEEKLQAAEAALQAALQSNVEGNGQGTEPDDKARDLLGQIASLRATLAVMQHDVETLFVQSRRALELLRPDNLPLRSAANFTLGHAYQIQGDRAAAARAYFEVISIGKLFGPSIYTTAATLCLGQVQETDNQLHLAAETYRRVILLSGDPPSGMACEAYLGLARIYYQWNDLEGAEQHAQRCVKLTQQMDSVNTVAACEVFLARLKLARGDVPGAVALLDEAEQFVRRNNFAFRMPDIAAVRVLVLLRQGRLAEAAHLSRSYDLPMSQVHVHLAQGDPAAALLLLEPLRREAEEKSWVDHLLRVMVHQAVALRARGETEVAVQLLGETLVLAKPHGSIRLFVDEGLPVAQLLSEAQAREIVPGYVSKLLAVFAAESPASAASPHLASLAPSPQPTPSTPSRSLIDALSEREVEVLQLMARGLSNREIGERLFLALSTVKGHNLKIFGKLQVQRRTEAVAEARSLGLL